MKDIKGKPKDKKEVKPTITFDDQSVRDVARLYKEWLKKQG